MAKASTPLDVTEPEGRLYGQMTIKFWEHGTGNVTPEVSFSPIGSINPNTIERFLPYIYSQINLRQTQQRHGK